jgi:hypothetical protein
MFPSHLLLGLQNGGVRKRFHHYSSVCEFLFCSSATLTFHLTMSVPKVALTECAMESRPSWIKKPCSICFFNMKLRANGLSQKGVSENFSKMCGSVPASWALLSAAKNVARQPELTVWIRHDLVLRTWRFYFIINRAVEGRNLRRNH